jgi:tRNA(Ile)-lysidine synthetase-like protein
MQAFLTFESGYESFKNNIITLFNLLKKPLRLGIACSGGPDSILLLHYAKLFTQEQLEKIDTILIIHVIDGHYMVEPYLQETMQQAYDLVILEAQHANFEYKIYKNTDTSKFHQGESIEALCHKMRKEYFQKALDEYGLDRIITGHNSNDQLEHFFIGMIRKSSLRRISGMKADNGRYIRPLLTIKKDNIKDILDKKKLTYVLDPCNDNQLYLRNALRTELPTLCKIDTRFEAGCFYTMNQIAAQEDTIDALIQDFIKKDNIHTISYFLDLPRLIQTKVIEKIMYKSGYKKTLSIAICDEIIRFLSTKKGASHQINNIIIIKHKQNWKIIAA